MNILLIIWLVAVMTLVGCGTGKKAPVKAVMIYSDATISAEAEEIAGSFRYLNSFMGLFHQKHSGSVFLVKKGQPFRVELPENPTTGYNWYVTEMDESRFRVASSGYNVPPNGQIGTGGTGYFEIIPLTEGPGTIHLQYFRSWEGSDKAVDDFKVRIMTTE